MSRRNIANDILDIALLLTVALFLRWYSVQGEKDFFRENGPYYVANGKQMNLPYLKYATERAHA